MRDRRKSKALKCVIEKSWKIAILLALSLIAYAGSNERVFVAPMYPEYLLVSSETFTNEVRELRQRVGESETIQVGFSVFLNMKFNRVELDDHLDSSALAPTLADLATIVKRARDNQLPIHIALASGFFHGNNALREAAIRADVRNAQWFSDGWIADPADMKQRGSRVPSTAWLTPSTYAQPLRRRIEESFAILGSQLASAIEQNPETILSISGDTEVELSFARHLDGEGRERSGGQVLLADYSPFMIAEFRDSLRLGRYAGDASPASDDNHDGHTFNQDFHQHFRTWQLRYFNESGAIPYEQYRAMPEKLPKSGPYFVQGGFDAPRQRAERDTFWKAWEEFRIHVVSNYLRLFAEAMTDHGRISRSRFYTHQIPAEYLFEGKNTTRLQTSASPLRTAFLPEFASPGVTVFDTYRNGTHSKTSSKTMFKGLEQAGATWGIVEYNPSVPAIADENYYLTELRTLNSYHPALIVPFAWTNASQHEMYRIQNTAFESALRKFVQESGRDIHR